MKYRGTLIGLAMAGMLAFGANPAFAQDIGKFDDATAEQAYGKRDYSPYLGQAYPTRVFWGDTADALSS